MKILFLGETYRADAKTWIEGISKESGQIIQTMEVAGSASRTGRIFLFGKFFLQLMVLRFREGFDIVLAERATSYGFFSLFIKTKIRVVAQQGITDAYPEKGVSGFYKRLIQKVVYQKVDLIHAWGKVMTSAMLHSGAKPEKIMILPKGINLERFLYSGRSEKFNSANAIVTRSLTSVYRHRDIIEAVGLLKKDGIHFQLNIVGQGPLLQELKSFAASNDVMDSVSFLGTVENRDLPELLGQNDLYLAMPETEGVSASLFEAMACGCFPIVTDLPANRAFIQSGINGFLVEKGNVRHLADAIKTYLKAPEDYEKAIKQNRKFIEQQVDLKKNMETIFQKYLLILKNKEQNS